MNPNDLSAYNEAFLKASKKHVEEIFQILENLKIVNLTSEIIDSLYLHLHSLKGECNIMGYNHIAEKCESSLLYLKEEKIHLTNSFNVINSIGDILNSIKQDILTVETGVEAKSA